MHTPLSIQLLGNFRLQVDGVAVERVNTPRLQALLAYLVLQRDAPQLRQRLAFQFWPDSSESQARTNLRKLFFQLQQALPHAHDFLLAEPQTLRWNPQANFTLDVAEIQQQLAHLHQEPLDLAALRRVVELYQGELLPGCYDDWIAPLRQQLHQEVMTALERLITLLENQRAYNTGIEYAQRLLAFDPLEERSYQRLMRLHALDGDYTGALRVYQECVAILQRELEVEPDAETQALYEKLRRRDTSLRAQPAAKAPPAAQLPLVGRQAEWQRLQQAWHKAVQGQAHFVCIWGEAGMGKTRLAEELLDWAERQGVLTARTRSYPGALAYAPVTTLLRNPNLASRLAQVGPTWVSEIARLLPELLDEQPGLPSPQPMNESWQHQRFLEALHRAVLSDNQPRLLVLDDLHWCDRETLTWLSQLLHFAPRERLLIVGTSRLEEVNDTHPLTALRLGLHREALLTELELTPLSASEVTTLAGKLAAQDLTSAQTQQLYAMTEGNPLFVVETVRAGNGQPLADKLDDEPAATQPNQSFLPPKVYAVILARLTQLSPAAQKIASLAAVLGRSFSFALLSAAARTDEETLLDSLDELGERRILREQGTDGYDFSHDRIRDVAYAEVSRARRRQLHQRVAEAIETVHAGSLEEVSRVLADHYEQTGNNEKTIHYLQRAGERATQIYAYQDALSLYYRALSLVSSAAQSGQGQNPLLRITLLIKLSTIHTSLSEYTTAQQLGEESLQLARTSGDQKSLADSLNALGTAATALDNYERAISLYQQALALYTASSDYGKESDVLSKLGAIAYHYGELEKATQLYEQAQQSAKAGEDRKGEAKAVRGLGLIIDNQGNPALAYQLYEQALSIYRDIGDRSGEADVLNMLALVAFLQAHYVQSSQLHEQALTINQSIGARNREARTLSYLAEIAWAQDEYGKSTALEQQALLIFRTIGDRWGEGFSMLGLALIAHVQGELAKANQFYEQALLIYQEIGNRVMAASALDNLGDVARIQGEYTKAAQLTEEAKLIYLDTGHRSRQAGQIITQGQIVQAQGDYTEAIHLYKRALEIFQDIGEQRGAHLALNLLGSVVCIRSEYPAATHLHQQALASCHEINDRSGLAMSLKGLGLIASQQGRYDEAIQHLQQALEISQGIGTRIDEAEIYCALGNTACGQQDYPTARRYFCHALSISQEIGAIPVLLASLVGVAKLLSQENQPIQALHLLGLVLHAHQTTAETKKRATHLLSTLQAEIPSEAVTSLLQIGEQLDLSQVVQEILQTT